MYSFGYGAFGQLGQGDDKDRTLPELIQDLAGKGAKVVNCMGSSNASAVLTASGDLYVGRFWLAGLVVMCHPSYSLLFPRCPRLGTRLDKAVMVASGTVSALRAPMKPSHAMWRHWRCVVCTLPP